jgi:hypothetical protein
MIWMFIPTIEQIIMKNTFYYLDFGKLNRAKESKEKIYLFNYFDEKNGFTNDDLKNDAVKYKDKRYAEESLGTITNVKFDKEIPAKDIVGRYSKALR